MKLQNNCSAKQRQNRLSAEQHDFTDQRLNQILYVRLLSTVYMFYVRSFKYSSSLKRCFLWSLLEKLQLSWIYCTAHRFIQLSSDGPKHLNIRCVELTQTRFVALQTETRTKLQTIKKDFITPVLLRSTILREYLFTHGPPCGHCSSRDDRKTSGWGFFLLKGS